MNIAQINTEARALVDADSTSYADPLLLIRVNEAYEEVVGKLIAATHGQAWSFGDSNFTSNPTGLKTMTNGTASYQLMGDGASTGIDTTNPLITFLGASVKTAAGQWLTLKHISLWELFGQQIDPAQYFPTAGLPQYYELRDDFIVLYPAPDNAVLVTLTSGLKVFYQRSAKVFTSGEVSTGTKIPGFALPFHNILSYKAALPYAASYKKDRVPFIMSEIARIEKNMLAFYGQRESAITPRMTMKKIQYM